MSTFKETDNLSFNDRQWWGHGTPEQRLSYRLMRLGFIDEVGANTWINEELRKYAKATGIKYDQLNRLTIRGVTVWQDALGSIVEWTLLRP